MSRWLFEFFEGTLRLVAEDSLAPRTLVADSWRVSDGTVVGLDLHEQRFSRSVAENTSLPAHIVADFLHAVRGSLPRQGEWFPRVEAIWHERGPQLRYHQRSAPPWSSQVIVARAPHDPRKTPQVKGPDLEALLKLRDHVAPLGADEALIVDSEDALSEGAYSTVMVWPLGGEQLHIVHHSGRLPSITERLLISLATKQGIPAVERTIPVSALEGSEVWIVSALHGIRQAMAFVDGPPLATGTGRRDVWQARWRALATHLDAPAQQGSR